MLVLMSVLVLFGAANCRVLRDDPKLHYSDLNYVKKDLANSYTASVSLGTPSQKFNVQLNTEHSYFFVPSVQCSDDFCQNRAKYNSDASSTHKPDGTPFHFVDRDDEYSGLLSKDSAKVGDLTVQNQVFGELLDVKSHLKESKIDGIFGLGFNQNNTFFDNLVAQGLIDAPIFSTHLTLDHTPQLIFGGSDQDSYVGDLQYVPVVGDGPCWQISLNSVEVGEEVAVQDAGTACVSLTNNFLEGPADQVAKINSLIGARKYAPIENTYEIDCSKVNSSLPDVYLYFDNEAFLLLQYGNFITHHMFGSKEVCLSIFSESEDKDNKDKWVLGLPVFQNTYTEFDYGKRTVAFAIAL